MRMCRLETPNSSSSNGLRKTSKGPRTNAEKWWPLPSWHSSWRPDRFVLSASMTSSQLDLEVTSAHCYKTHKILNCSWSHNFKSLTKTVFLMTILVSYNKSLLIQALQVASIIIKFQILQFSNSVSKAVRMWSQIIPLKATLDLTLLSKFVRCERNRFYNHKRRWWVREPTNKLHWFRR